MEKSVQKLTDFEKGIDYNANEERRRVILRTLKDDTYYSK